MIACASTVAVVVPSPAMSLVFEATSLTSWAPMFSNAIGQFDFFGDGHAVVGDRRRTELLVEHDVAALGSERHFDGVGEDVRSALERATRALIEYELLCSHDVVSITP